MALETMVSGDDEAQPRLRTPERLIQQFDDVRDLPLALSLDIRSRSIQALNRILADAMVLRDLYKKAHWQVSGATFYALHLLLDKHYEEQADAVDAIAERIMSLGGVSYAVPWDVVEATTIERPPSGREDVPSNLQRLLEAHRVSLAFLRQAAGDAAVIGDDGTNDLIVSELIRMHEPQVWFLAEHLAATRLTPEFVPGAGR